MTDGGGRNALVLGAGAVGLSAAWFLRRAGWSVRVVDRAGPGRGATLGTSGLICPAHSQPLPGPGVLGTALRWMLRKDSPFHVRLRPDPALARWLVAFARSCAAARSARSFRVLAALSSESLRLFAELHDRGDVDFFFRRRGGYFVVQTEAGEARLREDAAAIRAVGLPVEPLAGDAIREREPGLSPTIRSGVFVGGDAHGLSFGFAESLADALRRAGVEMEIGFSARSLIVEHGAVRGAVVARSDAGPPEERGADRTVLALGAWTPGLARGAGLRIPIQPARGYSATVDRFEGAPSAPVMAMEKKVILSPLGDRIRFGGTLELGGFGSTPDEPPDGRRYDAMVAGGVGLLKERPPMRNETSWAGFRPLTPDALPVIGASASLPGLLIAAGHGTLGFTQSLATGRLIAELADGRPPFLPVEPFSPDRFR